MSSNDIDRIFQRLTMVFLGAIVGGTLHSAGKMFYALAMMFILVVLLVLVLVYVNRREKELAQPNNAGGADRQSPR